MPRRAQAPAGNLSTTGAWWRDEPAGLARTVVNYTCVPQPGGGCGVITIFRQWNFTEAGNYLYIWQQHGGAPPLACTKLPLPAATVLPPVIAAGAVRGGVAPCPTGPSLRAPPAERAQPRAGAGGHAHARGQTHSATGGEQCTEFAFTDGQGQNTSVWVAGAGATTQDPGADVAAGTPHAAANNNMLRGGRRTPGGPRVVLQRVVSATGTAEVFIPADEFGAGAATPAMFALPNCTFVTPGRGGAVAAADALAA